MLQLLLLLLLLLPSTVRLFILHFRKIYLSLYTKWLWRGCERVMCDSWVGDWTNCNILTPSSFVFSSTSFSFCWAAQSGVLRAHSPLLSAGSLCSILSPTNWTSCRTGLYHCLTSTCFLWVSHLHPIQPVHSQGYTLISSIRCTCSLIDGWVRGQYVTVIKYVNCIFALTCVLAMTLNCTDGEAMLHTDLWQSRQSWFSGTGCSSFVHWKTAHAGW